MHDLYMHIYAFFLNYLLMFFAFLSDFHAINLDLFKVTVAMHTAAFILT